MDLFSAEVVDGAGKGAFAAVRVLLGLPVIEVFAAVVAGFATVVLPVVVGLVPAAKEALGPVLEVVESVVGLVTVLVRLAALELAGVIVDLRSLLAAAADFAAVVRDVAVVPMVDVRCEAAVPADFFFSSPEGAESPSWSEAVFVEEEVGRRVTLDAGGRVGGLLKLLPGVERAVVDEDAGALLPRVEVRVDAPAVDDEAAGRFGAAEVTEDMPGRRTALSSSFVLVLELAAVARGVPVFVAVGEAGVFVDPAAEAASRGASSDIVILGDADRDQKQMENQNR
jgi:hypothetical protein